MEVKAVFLDRDGIIIEDVHYLKKIYDIKLLPNVYIGLRMLKDCGFKLVVITNQSGVGRGYFTMDFVKKSNIIINVMLGNIIDDFFVCPHKPDENCSCRKPKTALLDAASEKFHVNRNLSYMIGDKESDIILGVNAHVTPILISHDKGYYKNGVYVFKDLLEVSKWICRVDFTA